MDNETKLKIEKWKLKLDDKIKYVLSLENTFTYILTKKFFYIHENKNDSLIQNIIPLEDDNDMNEYNSKKIDTSRIWSDKNGIHIIFKLDQNIFYYNNNLPENKKIKELILEYNNKYLEPYSFAFNDHNQNIKNTDEILFSDKDSCIYTLNIKIEENGEIKEKINKVFDFREENNIDDKNNSEENKDIIKEREEKLNKLLNNNYFLIEKDDKILDMKLYYNEEKIGTGRKAIIKKTYFILAVSKRIIFQFSGENSINEVFSKYKRENNSINKDELLKDCKIFPKVNKFGLEKTRIQLFSFEGEKSHYIWNNECGICTWPKIGSPLPLPQKEFILYNYIKLKNDGTYEKQPCPLMCCQTPICIYYLYNDCLVVLNTLTNNIIHVEYFQEEFLDMYYNKEINKLVLYSKNNIVKISLEHETNNLWKDYIERGEYNLALQYFLSDDPNLMAKLHKLNADFLFKKKEYDASAVEYGLSNENFEHICLKFLKLNDINPLFHYLDYVNKFILINDNKNNEHNYFIQKYLINTWLLEILLENKKIMKNKKEDFFNRINNIICDSKYIDSHNYIDKRVIYDILQSHGLYNYYIEFAGIKNDYQTIITDLVNHNKYKEAINNLLLYMSFSSEDEKHLKNLLKLFFNFANIFIKESPKEVIELVTNYYYLIEKPSEIIKIINKINIYDNNIFEENYENILALIKKLINVSKKSERKVNNENNLYDLSTKQNLYNLYILYLSMSIKTREYDELLDYLKTLVSNTKNDFFNFNNTLNKIYFDFSFVTNILKKSKSALALLYCLKKEYNKSISISLSNEDKDTSIFIANSISDPKKKKEVWLSIFNHFKTSKMNVIEEILNKSGGVLKILDILPHLMGDVHLKDIKNDLKNCINIYETKLKKLKIHIKDYGVSIDFLNQKVEKIGKNGQKSLKLKFEEINCAICLRNLKDLNFYLFPCRHAFDFDCLMNTLLYFDTKNIGDEFYKRKLLGIKQLINEIRQLNLRKKNIFEKKNSIIQNQKKQSGVAGFFRSLTSRNTNVNISFSANEEIQLQDLEKVLDELLSQECPLCGNEMILSTQAKFGDEDSKEWEV